MVTLFQVTAILALTSLCRAGLLQRAACDKSSLNQTAGSYIVGENDTIFSIAKSANRGVCDIARTNRMADATVIYAGENLTIPAQVCHPDSTSCLLTNTHSTRDCVLGGPHTYNTFPNDTIASIARDKLNITVESLWNGTSRMLTVNGPDDIIPAGSTIKLPQCNPSECMVKPYAFLYGTYYDLAKEFGTTPGQIFAFNPGYNHSPAGPPGTGPVITMPYKCKLLSDNYTAIS